MRHVRLAPWWSPLRREYGHYWLGGVGVLGWSLLCASVPAGLAGYLLQGVVSHVGDAWWLLMVTYLFTATWLWHAHRSDQHEMAFDVLLHGESPASVERKFSSDVEHRGYGMPIAESSPEIVHNWQEMSCGRAFMIGLAQIPALLPGISRSGATLGAALTARCERSFAVEVAFIIGLPLIAGAVCYQGSKGGYQELLAVTGWLPLAVAMLTSFISGVLAIWALRLVTQKGRLQWFAWYCVAVAIICGVHEIL